MNLFNTDWKNYVGKGEKVSLMKEIPNKMAIMSSIISSLILFIIITIWTTFFFLGMKNFKYINIALSIIIIAFILYLGLTYFRFKSMKYVITNKGILEIKGVFVKSYKFVPFVKITDTRLHRNILDLIFGTGSIDVSTAGGTRMVNGYSQPYEIRFLHVNDFMKVHELIKKSIK